MVYYGFDPFELPAHLPSLPQVLEAPPAVMAVLRRARKRTAGPIPPMLRSRWRGEGGSGSWDLRGKLTWKKS